MHPTVLSCVFSTYKTKQSAKHSLISPNWYIWFIVWVCLAKPSLDNLTLYQANEAKYHTKQAYLREEEVSTPSSNPRK